MAIKIRTKIILSFSSIFILLSFLGVLSMYNRSLLFAGMRNLEMTSERISLLSELRLDMDRVVMPANDYLITAEASEREKFNAIVAEVENGLRRLKETGGDDEIRKAEERFAALREKADKIFSIASPVGSKSGMEAMKELDSIADAIIRDYLDIMYLKESLMVKDEVALAGKARKRVDIILYIGSAISVTVVFLLALYLFRAILRPLDEFKEVAQIVGAGNLDYKIELRDGAEVNLLVAEFNKMTQKLKDSYAELERKVEERTKELNDANKTLNELSVTDGLTGLFNQRHFYTRLDDEVKRAERFSHPLSLILGDIDHFKHYNDSHGHLEGDGVLKTVAACIKEAVREQDIAARYGGEEFAVIVPEAEKNSALRIAERIRLSIMDHPFPHEETQPGGSLTISLGIASYPQDAEELKALIEKADAALYTAKETGRNRSVGASGGPLKIT